MLWEALIGRHTTNAQCAMGGKGGGAKTELVGGRVDAGEHGKGLTGLRTATELGNAIQIPVSDPDGLG